MSRLGKQPLALPTGVTATFADGLLTITGPKGSIARPIRDDITVSVADGHVAFTLKHETDLARALWGTYASHTANMIEGVTTGFTKVLEIEGVGYRAELKGKSISLAMGFSHPVLLDIPDGVTAVVEKNVITLTGIDKEIVGQFAADIRKVKKPEPYKGKGIRYQGEHIIRKQGKKAV